jgi:serine phosphatase RsbU (regulator of sigma subunit)
MNRYPEEHHSPASGQIERPLDASNQASDQGSRGNFGEQMIDSEITLSSFRLAELRSECARVTALLSVFGSLLALIVVRGAISLAHGRTGMAWPFAVLLAGMTAYESAWLRFIRRTIASNHRISNTTWIGNLFIESLLPTGAIYLEIRTILVEPHRALESSVVAVYFLLIILSTLHLSPQLSRLGGVFAAAGYMTVLLYDFLFFTSSAGDKFLSYSTAFSYAALMLVAGFAAGAVASQIRMHVTASLQEAQSRAKLEQDLNIARIIQRGLLPVAPPQINGFDIAGWNQPADETGGDYYDWQQLADGCLAVTIADVTGHGIGPAIGMAACRAYARAGLASGTDLPCFLGHLNQLLYADLPPEKFVTLATGLLNPGKGTLDLISAGHGPLLFYSSQENQFCNYDAQGPPLGLLPRCRYDGPDRLQFAPGDILVLVTDGFVEWVNADDEEFGQNRIEEVIRGCRDMPSAGIIDELYSAVSRFAASTAQLDDLTAVVVKCV